MFYNLKINVKIDKPYFVSSIKNIFNRAFLFYKSKDFILEDVNDDLWKVDETKLNDYYCETDQEYEIIYNYTLNKIKKIVFYIKTINPEFGKEWSIEFTISEKI
jgi:hypothetical protein